MTHRLGTTPLKPHTNRQVGRHIQALPLRHDDHRHTVRVRCTHTWSDGDNFFQVSGAVKVETRLFSL